MSTTQEKIIAEIIASKENVTCNAGAGCGKTTLLVKVGARIIESGESVLFLNGTRRACIEIHSHAEEFGITSIDREQVRTFHSLAFEYLNRSRGTQFVCRSPYWSENEYQIPDEIEGCSDEMLLKILCQQSLILKTGFSRNSLKQIATAYKNGFPHRGSVDRLLGDLKYKIKDQLDDVEQLLQQYENFRLSKGIYGYHDAIEIFSYVLHEKSAELCRRYQTVIVDECQDISMVQLEILESLHKGGCRIILVGDPRQCINPIMGAYLESFTDIKARLHAKAFSLNHSFRFGQPIADMANSVAQFIDTSSRPLIGNPKRSSATPVVVKTFCSNQMVGTIANEIEDLISSKTCRPCDILVCYRFTRGNRLLSPLKTALDLKKKKFVQLPLQKSQQKVLDQLLRLTEKSFKKSGKNILKAAALAVKKHKQKYELDEPIYEIFRKIASETDSLMDLIVDCKDKVVEYLLNHSPDCVVLSTIHSSKGSGYKYVFLLDCSEFMFSEKMKMTKKIKKDQAALLYVGITRAIHQFKAIYPNGRRLSRLLNEYAERSANSGPNQ